VLDEATTTTVSIDATAVAPLDAIGVVPLDATAPATSTSEDKIDSSTPPTGAADQSADAVQTHALTDPLDPKVSECEVVEESSTSLPSVATRRYEEYHVLKLLKVLHVYARYRTITGDLLPEYVDFFGKTLLGETSVKKFQDTVLGSLRSAQNYLDDVSELSACTHRVSVMCVVVWVARPRFFSPSQL